MSKKMSSMDFMQKHLDDACEPEYEALCEQVMSDLAKSGISNDKLNRIERVFETLLTGGALTSRLDEVGSIEMEDELDHSLTEEIDQLLTSVKICNEDTEVGLNFKEEIYEVAFGDNAINKDYKEEEVVSIIRSYSDQSHAATELILTNFSSIEDFEKAKLEYLEKYVA